MEGFLMIACLAAMAASTAASMLTFRLLSEEKRRDSAEKQKEPEPLPEELEARKAAAEAQRLYEQGFVNLMQYDGSPKRKEERDSL